MPIFCIGAYKKAEEEGNTLASANLGQVFLYAGLSDEASEVLNRAKLKEDVHPNVLRAIADLSQKRENESKKKENIMNGFVQQQPYLRLFAERYLLTKQQSADFNGDWQLASGEEMKMTTNDNSLRADWVVNQKKFNIVGTVRNYGAKITVNRMTYFGDVEISFEKESEGYLYLSDDQQSVSLMTMKDDSTVFTTLTKKIPELSS